MLLRILQASDRKTHERAFTIVELLIVIVIIGILAAITIVAYNGIIGRAHAAALQSDLSNGSKVLGLSNASDGSYPTNASDANNGQGLRASQGNTFTYNVNSDGSAYCLQASGYGESYFITSTNVTPQGGICNGITGLASDPSNPPYAVSTLAGNSTWGYVDGSGTSAEFSGTYGVAVDASGNVYVADAFNNLIRKITPSGMVSTLAGTIYGGSTNGPVASAGFNFPSGLTVDSSGNVYVADCSNNLVRKITSGTVSTVAGNGVAGSTNGSAASAEFSCPNGVAVDASGNVYVADIFNNLIRKITPSGTVSTLAGNGVRGFANGTGAAAEFNYPYGITIDSLGNIYVADTGNNLIRKITPSGTASTVAGDGTIGSTNGSAASAKFNKPEGVAIDSSGNIYVADTRNNLIRKITPSGTVSTVAGNGSQGLINGLVVDAEFNIPEGIAVSSSGVVYVADTNNTVIRVVK